MHYCSSCILPDTRPNLVLNSEGVCNACESHGTKRTIDWAARKESFREVVKQAKARSSGYDCLIPVSGGKDSTWQLIKCLEFGLNPLAVTWKTPARTEIGARNLSNLVSLGVDHVDYQINPKVERKFMYEALKRYGSTAIPMHMAIFNIPANIAVRHKIPLIIYGENSAFEYGGPEEERTGFKLDATWLRRYGVTHGTTASDWVSERLSRRELTPYYGPSEYELSSAGVTAVFLGYYLGWDPEITRSIAVANGFRADDSGARTGLYNFADIDDDFISIHHWVKWYKFGFSRIYDNLSLEIRNGRVTREEAVNIVRLRGDETPNEDIDNLCKYLDMTRSHFFEICETFRNPNIWFFDGRVWKIRDFLIRDWKWV